MIDTEFQGAILFKVFLHGKRKGHFVFVAESINFYFLFTYIFRILEKGDKDCGFRNNLLLFHQIYSAAHSIRMTIIKKQGTQYKKQLSFC